MIPPDWLGDAISVEEAEAGHPGITDERLKRFPEAGRPFGFQNQEWEALKAKMKPGDVLRDFRSPPESWQHLAGRAGIALVRGGEVVDILVTTLN